MNTLTLEWLNYHHLLYFWTAAKEGGITRAAEVLRLSQPTLSAQIRSLEASLGERLFEKAGRGVALTEAGKVVFRYADEIFGLGREMRDVLAGREVTRRPLLSVGISDALPKLMVQKLLAPVLGLPEAPRLLCREDATDRLLASLAAHDVDVVLTDRPLDSQVRFKAFSHLLAESGVAVFARPGLLRGLKGPFPECLHHAPWLLPTPGTAMRRGLDQWMAIHGLRPRIVGEFDDSALLKAFGQAGAGVFAAPEVTTEEVIRQYRVRRLGPAEGVKERIYAVSVERRLRNPAVQALREAAKAWAFA
ncbi:MAG TPA: transcriptional activator NhaR [Holophagaceae bacterium]|nr:transcriptional activator NhaR [Holophagaceae bacterium]